MITREHLRRSVCMLMAMLCAALFAAGAGFATPTGLNNIPTAEVVPADVLVWQAFCQFGEERAPGWFAGLKYGPAQNWEVGLDDIAAGPGSAGGPTLQAKYRIPLRDGAALALGAANISDDRERHGELFPYLVVSAPLGGVRGHLGRSWEHENGAWFLGADAAASRDLTLRADWIQTADGEEHVSSLGFIKALSARWLVEGWVSFPSMEEGEKSCVLKLNWVMPLG